MKQVVYISSPESKQIHIWQLREDGVLSLLQVMEVSGHIQPMVVSPKKDFLYIGVRPNFRVLAFRIAADGTLKEAGKAPLPGSPTYISTDRTGHYLFCSSYNNACISISPIGKDGLPRSPTQVIHDLDGCHFANIDYSNQMLFVTALKQDRIYLYSLSTDGKLVPHAQVMTLEGAGPRHITFHPNGSYAYCVNELNSTVDLWVLNNAHGEVEHVQSMDMMKPDSNEKRWASDIHITPNGHFLYACDRTSSIITVFSIREDSGLMTIEGYQPTENQPRGFSIDNSGRYLVAAGQNSHHIVVYRINDRQGLLTPLGRYAVGQGPIWVVIHKLD
ncbi:6-phosphogluconolactonase [Pantoea sp. Nvir]|uniref:6-phosphogluconolactonase n=1 Tax=Pantoea sp. Nvir TaxID=2576760 RepID=UPI001356D09A|nr:6-phosphogluconolactonase [Pantoea sp. Nvir]MXP66315.1 6-phosphogluconolactonase [Pantoea sp. Nvir]CAJ0992932.1 6-phosphogluconolactonase [Pantoea sp. Nvir]